MSFSSGPSSPILRPMRFTNGAEWTLQMNPPETAAGPSNSSGRTGKLSKSKEKGKSSFDDSASNGGSSRRGSILVAASDAFTRFGSGSRKRKSTLKQPVNPTLAPIILPDVMEISTSTLEELRKKREAEDAEERERFRREAAEALGIPSYGEKRRSTDDDVDHDMAEEDDQRSRSPSTLRNISPPTLPSPRTPPPLSQTTGIVGRNRSGSMPNSRPSYSRSDSTSTFPIGAPSPPASPFLCREDANLPSFPALRTSLTRFSQRSSSLTKYYAPSSLRLFALSSNKHWKTRFMIFTHSSSSPLRAFLHLFKDTPSSSNSASQRELERLEITEDSLVYIAEEPVGGRSHVVTVGGIDVSFAQDSGKNVSQQSQWHLHVSDSSEAHLWLSTIKSYVYGQRSLRAGHSPTSNGRHSLNETQGEDVAQNQPLTLQTSNLTSASSQLTPEIQSQRSNGSVLVTNALKSLFSGGSRPRSLSVPSERESGASLDLSENGLSFGSSGQTMLNDPSMGSGRIVDPMLLQQRIVDDQEASMLATPIPPPSPMSFGEQRIKDRRRPSTASSTDPPTVALQPAPRKRWTASGLESPVANSFTTSTRMSRNMEEPELRSSIDTTNTASTSSRRGSMSKRWSRTLPQRLTPPPASSLPALPGASDMGVISPEESTPSPSSSSRMSMSFSIKRASMTSNYSINGSGHTAASNSTGRGKRASISSAYSTGTSGSRSSFHNKRPSSSSGRQNVPPPPRPAPTSALPRPPVPSSNSSRPSSAINLKRLSLALPMKKPPPSTELPPRPDEDSEPSRIRLMSAPTVLPPIAATPTTPIAMERRMSYIPPPDTSLPEDIPPPRLETQPSFPKLKALSPPPRRISTQQQHSRKGYVANTETFAKRSTVVKMQPTLSSASEDSLVNGGHTTSTSESSSEEEDEDEEADVRSLGPG